MAKKPFAYAILEGIRQEMKADEKLCFCYEFEYPSAMLPTGEVIDLAKEFPPPRTAGSGWAIDETWYVGWVAGMGASGVKAIARIPSMASIYGIEFVFNQIGKIRSMTGGQASMPIVIWQGLAGRGAGMAGQHADAGEEALYAYLPGVKVVVPSNAYDAKGLMVAAIRDPDPVIFMTYGGPASGEQPDVPDEAYTVPIGKAAVRQAGTDLTIVAWGDSAVQVKKALPDLASAGIKAEFIDPVTIKPLDVDALVTSVKKTGRLLVVDHGHWTCGFGSHVIAEVAQKVDGAKCRRIAFPDAPAPAAAEMIGWMNPDAPKVVEAAKFVMKL